MYADNLCCCGLIKKKKKHRGANLDVGRRGGGYEPPLDPPSDVYEVLGCGTRFEHTSFRIGDGAGGYSSNRNVFGRDKGGIGGGVGVCGGSEVEGDIGGRPVFDKSINRETMGFSRDFAAGPGGPTPVGFRPIVRPNRKTRGP